MIDFGNFAVDLHIAGAGRLAKDALEQEAARRAENKARHKCAAGAQQT